MARCPKCGAIQSDGPQCPACGVYYHKIRSAPAPEPKRESIWTQPLSVDEIIKRHPLSAAVTVLLSGALVIWVLLGGLRSGQDSPRESPHAKDARQACAEYVRGATNFPRTVDIHWFSGVQTRDLPDGNLLVHMRFTAKNAFGVEIEHQANCRTDPRGQLLNANIQTF
jgi:hypothetical protein